MSSCHFLRLFPRGGKAQIQVVTSLWQCRPRVHIQKEPQDTGRNRPRWSLLPGSDHLVGWELA